jgi:hypothetical protein
MVTSGPLRLERQNETGNDAKHRPLSVAVEMPTAADTARHCPPIGQNRCWCICAYLFLSAQRPALYLHLHLHPAFCQHPKGPKNQKAKKPKSQNSYLGARKLVATPKPSNQGAAHLGVPFASILADQKGMGIWSLVNASEWILGVELASHRHDDCFSGQSVSSTRPSCPPFPR